MTVAQCPLYLRKRTLLSATGMSALCQKRTFCGAAKFQLFDHLVGASKQRLRHSEPEGLRSFEVDDQFVLGGRLHREIARFLAFEDAKS